MNKIEVIGLGALNMDYIYKVERILDDGEAVAEEATSSPGGSAANTIYGLARLGVNTGFSGAIGDDADGEILLRDFKKVGVDTSQIKTKPRAKTGSVLSLSDKLGKRSLYVTPGANKLLTMDDLNLNYINRAKMLHVSSFVGDAQLEVLLKLITKLNSSVEVSFSPGSLYVSKGLQTLTPLLAKTYVLFINESEIRQLTGEDFISGAKRCLDLGCRIIAVTLGKGVTYKTGMATSYIRDAEQKYVVEPVSKDITSTSDTTGAGDAFAAGFLYGLLNRKGLEECGRLGDVVARFSISEIGAREGLPTLAELTQRYHDLYGGEL